MELKKNNEIRYFSMFSGVGGFELGIGDKGRCVGYSEVDKYSIQTYQKNFPNHINFGDATKIKPEELPDFDLLCGGFPCQAFSIAGKRRGFNDTRGTMFFEIARIVKIKRPKIVLLENVKGLLNHEKGKTFSVILQTLDELGYEVQWMVLNSKFFGVPQNRERVFIIGSLRGECRPEIFPFSCNEQEIKREGTTVRTFTAGGHSGGLHSNSTGIIIKGYLNENGWDKRHESIRRVYGSEGDAPTIPTGTGGGVMTKIAIQNHFPRSSKTGKGGTGLLESSEHCFALDRSPHYLNKIRRLTPTECERLQGFPDAWTEGVSDTQRYKQMGNAVTVNVIKAIANKLDAQVPLNEK